MSNRMSLDCFMLRSLAVFGFFYWILFVGSSKLLIFLPDLPLSPGRIRTPEWSDGVYLGLDLNLCFTCLESEQINCREGLSC